MKKIALYAIAILLILCGCKQQTAKPTDPTQSQTPTQTTVAAQPSATTTPTTPSKPSDTAKTTETIAPTETAPKELSITDWQLDVPNYLSYEEYFSVRREFGQTDLKSWIKGDRVFTVSRSNDPKQPYTVECMKTKEYYYIPLSDAYATYEILGADGHYGYLHNESQFVRVNLASGETETLVDGQTFWQELTAYPEKYYVYLYDNLVLYYATYVDNTLTVSRFYLPTLKQEILHQEQGEFYSTRFSEINSNKESIVWTVYNPEFVDFVKKEHANPDSQFRKMPLYGGAEYKDYSEYWEDENGVERILSEPLLMLYMQQTSGIRAIMRCTYDSVTAEVERKTGFADNGYIMHNYNVTYDTELTTLQPPEVLLTPWTNFVEESPFDLYPKAELEQRIADCTLVTGVDSYQYLYVKTDGNYRKIIDTPVSLMTDTGTCVLCVSADRKELFAVNYEGTRIVKLYQATRGEIRSNHAFLLRNERLVVFDGDMLVVLDFKTSQYRELVRHENLEWFKNGYNGQGFPETSIYFEVSREALEKAYAIDPESGRFEQVGVVS